MDMLKEDEHDDQRGSDLNILRYFTGWESNNRVDLWIVQQI